MRIQLLTFPGCANAAAARELLVRVLGSSDAAPAFEEVDTQAPAMTAFQVGGFAPGGVSMAHGMSVVNGVVDDLAIWHRALVPDELAYLATHAVP